MKKVFLLSYLLLFTLHIKAQVPVSKEPRHHMVFENKKVRLLNVLLPPADTTQYHVHSTPSVFICFTKTNTASQLIRQLSVSGTSNAGTIWFEDLKPPHIKIHRVWNLDTDTFHVMDIELLSADSGFSKKATVLPHAQLIIDTSWARAYKIELARSEQVAVEEHSSAFIIVAITGGTITMIKNSARNTLPLQPGKFFWIEPDEQFIILNQANHAINFALIEVR